MNNAGFVGVVAAMPAEARRLASHAGGLRVSVCGPGALRAAAAAGRLVSDGAIGLVSWGCAGGLIGRLPAGALLLPRWVSSSDGYRYHTFNPWRVSLLEALGGVTVCEDGLVEVLEPVRDPAQKDLLAAASGAVAIDMESAAVARAASEAGIPLLVVRTIVDPPGTGVPEIALAGLGVDGSPRLRAALLSVLRRPWQLPALLATAARFRRALITLDGVAGRLPMPPGAPP